MLNAFEDHAFGCKDNDSNEEKLNREHMLILMVKVSPSEGQLQIDTRLIQRHFLFLFFPMPLHLLPP